MTEPRPDGKGVQLAVEAALRRAGIDRDRINYVNAHGTSTPAGDLAEYRAIKRALPGAGVRMNSTKSMIGHLMGAAGAVEAVAAIQAIRHSHPRPLFLRPALRMHGIGGHRSLCFWSPLFRATACAMACANGGTPAGRTGWLHPNLNLDDPDPDVDLNLVVGPNKQQHAACPPPPPCCAETRPCPA